MQDYADDDYVEDFFDESDSTANNSSRKKFRCQFAFHDRESGMFYTAFESEFQAYLWQTYGARISVMETNANWSGKPANAVPVNAAGKYIRYIVQNVVVAVVTTLAY